MTTKRQIIFIFLNCDYYTCTDYKMRSIKNDDMHSHMHTCTHTHTHVHTLCGAGWSDCWFHIMRHLCQDLLIVHHTKSPAMKRSTGGKGGGGRMEGKGREVKMAGITGGERKLFCATFPTHARTHTQCELTFDLT